jgi:hypothetical protein
LLSLVLAALTVALVATSASAETITVTRADDPAPDGCATNGCSLREAIALGNTTAGNQVIDIGSMEIVITSTITMTGDMTITGVNTTDSVIRTNGEIHMFSVMAGADVTFTKVWVYGAQEGGPGDCGGAIHNAGTLHLTMAKVAKNFLEAKGAGLCNVGTATLNQAEFLANNSGAQQGGAIFNSGTLDIIDSTFNDNGAVEGGALSNDANGTVTINNSTFSDNTADTALCGDCTSGGAISTSGTLTIEYSTVSGNTADNGAGLVSRGTTTIRRSTFAQNTGGAINNSDGQMTISRSTIASNTGKAGSTAGIAGVSNNDTLSIVSSTIIDNPSSGFQYGGIFTNTTASTTYKASVIANNGTANCHTGGNQTSQGYNVFAPATSACKSDGPSDTEVADEGLGVLGDNGGPTDTNLPQAGSAAINHGGPGCPAPDQRGALIADTQCDSGAVELSGTPPTPTPSPSPTSAPAGYPMGDVDCSDTVTTADLVPALNLVTKVEQPDSCGRTQLGCFDYQGACYPPWVDPNCDNMATALDVLYIAAHLAGAPMNAGGCTPVGEYIGFGP